MRVWIIVAVLLMTGCASYDSPADSYFEELPRQTLTRYFSQKEAVKALRKGECVSLARHLFTVGESSSIRDEMRKAASTVDTSVQNDGGNSYLVKNRQWVNIGGLTTRLELEFVSLSCTA